MSTLESYIGFLVFVLKLIIAFFGIYLLARVLRAIVGFLLHTFPLNIFTILFYYYIVYSLLENPYRQLETSIGTLVIGTIGLIIILSAVHEDH